MEPSAAQMDEEEEELMDIVAARSQGGNREAEFSKLEILESEAQQREEDEQSKRAQMGRSFQSSQHHPSKTGDNPMREEIKEEEKEEDTFILQVVQEQIKNHGQDTTSKTLSAEAGCPSTAGDNSTGKETRAEETWLVQDELGFPQPRLARGQNQANQATMRPGAYTAVPGTDLHRTTTLSRSLVGATSSSHVEELTSNAIARNQSTADGQATTPTDNINGLVVANQVEENEEPTQIARPDHLHGENKSTSMTLMILVLIGSILIVGVIVGSICGAGLCSNKEGDAPTSFRYIVLEDIQNIIEQTFGPDYFPKNDEPEPTQPKFKALDWIVFEDPLQLNPDANNLLQRFILSLTSFQTSRESDWLACGPSKTANDETCWIQIQGSDSLASRWLTGVHECQWAGIFCDGENRITQLRLRNNGLNGPLPAELASLLALESIDFLGNQLTGSIPVELFGSPLSKILLTNNSLTGTVPTEVGLFDGVALGFGSNSLSGSIPTELFHAGKRIRSFYFYDNKLTGTLPTEIGALHGIFRAVVYLEGNPLHGTIPSEIGLLQGSLAELYISGTHMDGSIPEELFTECTNLAAFRVSNCGFAGTISTGLQLLTKLELFDISNNKFHGTIPAQLSALTKLTQFIVNGNDLSGSIPSSVCALADPTKWRFQVAADCLPRGGTGDPMPGS
ncbi:leucine Rich Repeat [Seminavis robusta]|uniref:Leucine Rich Repeat n=1 Tax=Seminavis robusta TaxID=568900 RepID=A0A9N8DB21_9STRA|nr:leucine Rich Repeat [Seminavis robusta]|eukprot:Sro5_g004180.1 leucine Rich Repeat (679) ;mRNA; r:76706-79149